MVAMLCIRTNLHVITIFVSILVCLMLDFANSKGRQEVMCALQNIKFNNNICAPIFLFLVPINTKINLYMQEPYRKCVVIFCQAAVLVDVLYCLVDRNRNAPGVDPQVIHQYCCIQNLAVHYLNATDNNSSIFYLYGS